jgi:hypothetical protein
METVSKPTAARVLAVRPVGTTAVLAELAGLHDVLALQALLLEHPFPGQVDILAAAETVLIKADSPQSARRIAARLPELDLAVQAQAEGKLVQIDTVYDGEDLAEVGRLTGLGVEGVVAAHTGAGLDRGLRRLRAWVWVHGGGERVSWKSRGGVHRGLPSPQDRWHLPATTLPCIRGSRRAAGS